MKTKNALIIGTLIMGSVIGSNAYADTSTGATLSGSISESGSVLTDSGTVLTNSGITSSGTTSEVTSTGMTSTGVTSSGTTSTGVISEDREKINDNRKKIIVNWGKFHEENGFLIQFLKKPATKTEAKKIVSDMKKDIKSYHDAIKALIKEGQDAIKANSFDPVAFNAKATDIFAKQTEALSKYVDPAKMDAFKKFMNDKLAVILANKDLRKINFELRQEIKEIKKAVFSEAQRKAIADKLLKKQKNFLERLLNVIDVYSSKAKSDKVKAQLEELKVITQETIDSMK